MVIYTAEQWSNFYKNDKWFRYIRKFKKYCESKGELKCAICGYDKNKRNLKVHHVVYRTSRKPWDYSYLDLRLLCEKCHVKLHEDGFVKIKRKIFANEDFMIDYSAIDRNI